MRVDNKPDIIYLDKLLEAAGVDLADKSRFGSSSVTTPVSQRYNGVVIIVTVRYSNAADPSTTTYKYTASVIPDSQYKIFQLRDGGGSLGTGVYERKRVCSLVLVPFLRSACLTPPVTHSLTHSHARAHSLAFEWQRTVVVGFFFLRDRLARGAARAAEARGREDRVPDQR